MIKIKSIELHKNEDNKSRIKATGTIVLSNDWYVDITIMSGNNRYLFVVYRRPHNVKNDEFCRIINKNVRLIIEEEVIKEYNKL